MSQVKCCPACKRPFAPEVQVGGILRQRLYDYVARNPQGVTRQQIIDYVYHDDANGGPDNPNIIPVVVKHVNNRLEAGGHAIRIRGWGGPGSTYKLVRST